MSKLERRCQRLLAAYPAEYRRERGDEILGTLLEATPESRDWPRARDVRALIIGGLRARAAANRGLSTAANIRLALLLGVAIYLSQYAASYVRGFAQSMAGPSTEHISAAAGWRELTVGLLIAAVVTCAWRGRRRLLIACALPAAVAAIWLLVIEPAYDRDGIVITTLTPVGAGVLLMSIAALLLLARPAERPARSWLWLIGSSVAVATLAGPLLGFELSWLWPAVLLAILIVIIALTVVDARPALGVATYIALGMLRSLGDTLQTGGAGNGTTQLIAAAKAMWPLFAVLLAVGGLALWRLCRRRTAH
jgi:hypothetical protein